MKDKIQISGHGTFARIIFDNGRRKLFLTLDDRFDIYLDIAGEVVMRFPAQGCGPKRILERMKRNKRMMTELGSLRIESIARLVNEARLEMLDRARN